MHPEERHVTMNIGPYIGAAVTALLAILGWGFYIDRRISKLEGKIDLLLKVGCGRCNGRVKNAG